MTNRLAGSTSPYLLQHQFNPVHWREWGAEALQEASESDKPILLSIGYSACHWCHVMAHESFEDDSIAQRMNDLFVNIKVDREERPDLDFTYQHALALMGQQGGWPLTMFLTPKGEPFWGGTYFPPEPRYGRPGLPQVLEQVAKIWREQRHTVDSNRDAIMSALASFESVKQAGELTLKEVRAAYKLLKEHIDTIHGGLGDAPKFPQAPVLQFLWGMASLDQDPLGLRRLRHTVNRICQGGIYDHLGGGFARYSVDAYWLVPHFEKMLYDNAQLIRLLAEAHAVTKSPLLERRVAETIAWLKREMMTEGALASALDADSEGEEGKFYVWDATEIEGHLGDDASDFMLAYGVTRRGNWEGKSILNRLHDYDDPDEQQEEFLEACRQRLLKVREQRPRPSRDDKVLVDWNGQAIRGLAIAGRRFDRADWITFAIALFDRILEIAADGSELHHSYRQGRRLERAFLDDYAQMAAAAIALFEATGSARFLDQATSFLIAAEHAFGDGDGGFFYVPQSATDLIVRPRNFADGPTPSAHGTIAENYTRLAVLTGDKSWDEKAKKLEAGMAGSAMEQPFGHVTALSAAGLRNHSVQIVLVAPEGGHAATDLWREIGMIAPSNAICRWVADAGDLSPNHPAYSKLTDSGEPEVYICPGQTCLLPVSDVRSLRETMAKLAPPH